MTKNTKNNATKAPNAPVTATTAQNTNKAPQATPEPLQGDTRVPKVEKQAPKAEPKVDTAPDTAKKPDTGTEPKKLTKKEIVRQMLSAENGASITEIAEKTGWQNHTVHGHLAGVKKTGVTITSEKVDDIRRYRIVSTDNA